MWGRSLPIHLADIAKLRKSKGELSDETITLDGLESLSFSSFSELVPYLERIEEVDLAYQRDREDATEYEPILLPEDEAIATLPDDTEPDTIEARES